MCLNNTWPINRLTGSGCPRTGRDELLDTAMALHDAAMKDDYFISRRLAPNVDFWCVSSDLETNTQNIWLTIP